MKTTNASINQAASVNYTIEVLNNNGEVVKTLPRKHNLILDQGLDGIAVRTWESAALVAVVGTGTTPVRRDSGATTLSRSGTTVTASASFFEAGDVGRLIKWDSGEESKVTSFTSATEVVVADSGTIAADAATIWYVDQVGLATETKRVSGPLSAVTSFIRPVLKYTREFTFSAETGTITYREIGWSHTTIAGNNLFGRDLLPGSGVTLTDTQQLRVTLELDIELSPTQPVAWTNPITGFTSNGQFVLQGISISTIRPFERNPIEPSSGGTRVGLITNSTALSDTAAAFVEDAGTASQTKTLSTYVAGSFTRTHTYSITTTQENVANFRKLVMGIYVGNPIFRLTSPVTVLLDSPETKASTHTLTLVYTYNWGRKLSNA